MDETEKTHLISWSSLAKRYDCTSRTLWNWERRGLIESPIKINGRNYATSEQVERNDQRLFGDLSAGEVEPKFEAS